MPVKATVLLAAALLMMILTVCGGGATPTPDFRIQLALERLNQLEDRIDALEDSPRGNSISQSSGNRATPPRFPAMSLVSSFNPTPTPNPSITPWVHQRLDALIQLYDLSDEGIALLQSLDLRQMRGEPGFFGSYGFKKWAGVGEAKPQGVMHEIGHSYWGAFPISGFPDLSWDKPSGNELSPAMEKYHEDILSFMAQPPDDYEIFRQRLRNLPELSDSNREPLFHNLEAGIVYSTGGNLSLVPPILRKYWDRFLNEGKFESWYQAVNWFSGLNDDRTSGSGRFGANKYLGFEHLDLRTYYSVSIGNAEISSILVPVDVLAREERQRLFDLADQFDLLLGEAQEDEQFEFWRGYLRDKVRLNASHPGYLADLALTQDAELPRASSLAQALDFLNSLDGLSTEEQADRVGTALREQPFLVNFLPVLENRTLLALFASETRLPQGETLQATASFVDRLERFGTLVAEVLEAGRTSAEEGADELAQFLDDTDFEQTQDLRLFFDLFREQDPATASLIVLALDKETLRDLMEPVATQLLFTLSADELLEMLDITVDSSLTDLKRGVTLLLEEPSGNFIIDEPFLTAMYRVIANRGNTNPTETLTVLRHTPFPLEGFIQTEPIASADLLASDLGAAMQILEQSDPVVSPTARNVYRMVQKNPELAARLVAAFDEGGKRELVVESLAYLAYDKARSSQVPSLPISLEQDGKYLAVLAGRLGDTVLQERLSEAFTVYRNRASLGEVAEDFPVQYRATLDAAVVTIPDPSVREILTRIISEAAAG